MWKCNKVLIVLWHISGKMGQGPSLIKVLLQFRRWLVYLRWPTYYKDKHYDLGIKHWSGWNRLCSWYEPTLVTSLSRLALSIVLTFNTDMALKQQKPAYTEPPSQHMDSRGIWIVKPPNVRRGLHKLVTKHTFF